MTFIQFEYIIAVDNYRHFGRAAEACFVTQPTLSMQINKLEDQLGIIIFDRSKQPVVPTDIGKRVIKQARVAVSELKKVKEIVEDEKGEISGEIRIGIIPTLSPYLLPLFINSFIKKYPSVNIKVEELITEHVITKLKNELLDVGLIVTPYSDPGLVAKPLFYEEFFAYVSDDSELSKQKELIADDLPSQEVWLLNEGHCFRDQVLNLCHNYNDRESQFKYESGSLEALKKIVDKHGGLTLLPELATNEMSDTERKKLRKFKEPKPVREVSMIMHRSYLKRKLVEALHKEILASIPSKINVKKHGEVISWK